MRVAVVGAGIMGASTARALAERGHQVTLLEQFALGHKFGSSHGRSRIVRKAYPDPFYTAVMDEAYGLWDELQSLCDDQLLFECGLLYFGSFSSENLLGVLRGLQEVGVRHETLEHDQVRRVFPGIRLQPGEIGIFTPDAGWVHAEIALKTTIDRALDLGCVLIEGERADVDRLEADFDRYVLCAGPWIRDTVDVPVEVTLQTVGYVDPRTGLDPLEGPVWIEDGPEFLYGFPSEPGARTFKIGVHERGVPFDPNLPDRLPDVRFARAIQRQARYRFGAGARARFHYEGCLYSSTSDEDFLFGRHGERGYFVSACSGHGFKFGPWIGRKMADFVEERDAPDHHPRFYWPEPSREA